MLAFTALVTFCVVVTDAPNVCESSSKRGSIAATADISQHIADKAETSRKVLQKGNRENFIFTHKNICHLSLKDSYTLSHHTNKITDSS